jgi:hypothetical protein
MYKDSLQAQPMWTEVHAKQKCTRYNFFQFYFESRGIPHRLELTFCSLKTYGLYYTMCVRVSRMLTATVQGDTSFTARTINPIKKIVKMTKRWGLHYLDIRLQKCAIN